MAKSHLLTHQNVNKRSNHARQSVDTQPIQASFVSALHSKNCPVPRNISQLSQLHHDYLFLGVEDFTLSVLGLSQLLPAEVLIVEAVGELDTLEVQLGLGGDDVGLVDSTEGAAIQVVGTWQKTRCLH